MGEGLGELLSPPWCQSSLHPAAEHQHGVCGCVPLDITATSKKDLRMDC